MDDLFVYSVSTEAKKSGWNINVHINGKPTILKLDTVSQANILSMETYRRVASDFDVISRYSPVRLQAFGGGSIQSVGDVWLTCQYKGKQQKLQFQVVNAKVPNLIREKDCIDMGLIQRVYHTLTVPVGPEDVIAMFDDVFKGIGCIKGITYKI